MSYKILEQGESILPEFPCLTSEEMNAVNELFSVCYIFFKKTDKGRTVWTTCCHVDGEKIDNLSRTEFPRDRLIKAMEHNKQIECPYCGRTVTVKNLGKLKRLDRLNVHKPVLFIRASEDGQTVWAQGYWTQQDFTKRPAGHVAYMPTSAYQFQVGEVLHWERTDWSKWNMKPKEVKTIAYEPFTEGSGMMWSYCTYHVIGLNELKRSFLRYTGFDQGLCKEESDLMAYIGKRKFLIRFLSVAALYPYNVEMLLKSGMTNVVFDYAYRRKKNADCIRWGEKDPRKAFGLTTAELKQFLLSDRDLDILRIYQKINWQGAKVSLSDAIVMIEQYGAELSKKIAIRAKKNKVPVRKLISYIGGFAGSRCHGGGVTANFVARYWCDYIDAAIQLRYDLRNPLIQMPRDIEAAHDAATKAASWIMDEEKRKKAGERYKTLQRKYGYENDRYLIRAPYDADEITNEGKVLKHCVGGYAERYATGACTILFLRNKERPGKPLVTIEIYGTRISQIHGYKNERDSCPENPKRISPKKLYAEILEPWLKWVKAGSKRDKEGNPKLPKKRINKQNREVNVA